MIPDKAKLVLPPSLLLLLVTLRHTTLSVELHKVWSCGHETLALKCPEHQLIAVHTGIFLFSDNVSCSSSSPIQNPCQEDLRASINNRCGGHSVCAFNLSDDHWNRDECSARDQGAVVIEYDCLPVDSVQRYCSTHAVGPEGYLASPGYPGFFPKLPNCTWNVTAGTGQTLLLSVLDVDLPLPRRHYGRLVCDDVLHLADGTDTKLLSICGQQPPQTIESTGERVTVYFQSRSFTPFRGFLLYYRVRGCPTLPAPKLGYLVYRNGSSSLYMCCEGHLFNDTLDNYRPLHCVDGFHWNATVPHSCVSIEDLRESGGNVTGYLVDLGLLDNYNATATSHRRYHHDRVYKMENNFIADIVIPSVLMAGLVIGNAVVFLVIIRIRRSQKYLEEGSAEPKPSSSQEGAPFTSDS